VPVAVADGRVVAVVSQSPHMDGVATMRGALQQNGLRMTSRVTAVAVRDAIGGMLRRAPVTVPVVAAPGAVGVMTTPDAEPGMKAIAGPTWRNEVAARALLDVGPYRPGSVIDQLHCPILIQVCDRDLVTPAQAAQDAAWRATGRSEVRTYPIGHFEIYTGAWFEKAVGHQLHFLRRHLGNTGPEGQVPLRVFAQEAKPAAA
jgi:pimeloyl-ACP methyl ester carboxylesterase